MFKKSIYISLGLFSLMFCATLFFQSCRKCENKICNIEFRVEGWDSLNLEPNDGIDTSIGTLRFSFNAIYEEQNPACAFNSFGFNAAYAFSKDCFVTNAIVDDSYRLELDQDIIFNTTTILAGTDLILHPLLKDHWTTQNGSIGDAVGELYGTIELDAAISNQIQFTTGTHDVTLSLSTDDGQNLSKHRNVVFKL